MKAPAKARTLRIVSVANGGRHRFMVFAPAVLLVMIVSGGSAAADNLSPTTHPSRAKSRVCLSLRVLARQAEARPGSAEVQQLGGLGWLEGYVIDRENRDVILIGRTTPGWPSLCLDDLAVNLRNVRNGGPYSYCSLDPQPEDVLRINQIVGQRGTVTSLSQMRSLFAEIRNAWGPQMIVVGGVPRDSRHAHVTIDADYHMKKLSQGLVRVNGIPSCLDLAIQDAKQAMAQRGAAPAMGVSASRLWFHVGEGEPTFREDEDIVCLDRCSVVVLTETQRAAADGTLYDSGGYDPYASAFARELSNRFSDAATRVPVYADLENLFRLSALVRAMHLKDAANEAQLDLRFYLEDYQYRRESPMASSLPGLVNGREIQGRLSRGNMQYQYVLLPMVCGGVSMEMSVGPERFQPAGGAVLDHLYQAVRRSRPHQESLCWTVRGL